MTSAMPTACARRRRAAGFALVATVILLVLLSLLVTALLSLSSLSLRASGRGEFTAQARANARLSLALALGELQKHTGSDTRVTARADLLQQDHPPVLGAWKSWEGTDHDAQGRPVSPGSYRSEKERRFLAWLVSTATGREVPDTRAGPGKIALLGEASVGSGAEREPYQIHLAPFAVEGGSGRGAYAWWVSGENQKARLPKPYQPDDTEAQWSVLAKTHAVADPEPFRMQQALAGGAGNAEKAISLASSDFVSAEGNWPASQEFFHDLSTISVGLLTNAATGGWRKDLSLFTESWDDQPTADLPLFRVRPGEDLPFGRPVRGGNYRPNRSLFYPWANYRSNQGMEPIYQHGAVSSWAGLKDFALLYKQMTATSAGRIRGPFHAIGGNRTGATDVYDFLHRVRTLPLIARVQWLYSHQSVRNASPSPGAGTHQLKLLVNPVITMWNPYNVEISCPPLRFNMSKCLPSVFSYKVGNQPWTRFHALNNGHQMQLVSNPYPTMDSAGNITYVMELNSSFVLRPGETAIFSATGAPQLPGNPLSLAKGSYRLSSGHLFSVKSDDGRDLTASAADVIRVNAKFDAKFWDEVEGVGIYLDMTPKGGDTGHRYLAYRMAYEPAVAQALYGSVLSTEFQQPDIGAVESNPTPFLTAVFGSRMASDTHLAAKGFVQSSPFVNYTAMGKKGPVDPSIRRQYGGALHPVNSPFDFSFFPVASGDSRLPNFSDQSGSGYIVSGFDRSSGLARAVIAELPVRPLASLGELQHWDLRYENPVPPFQFNLIGNSDASPLFAPDAVTGGYAGPDNLQYDDAYCANHLLFDDWFVSSIAPNPNTFGPNGKSLQETYVRFVEGKEPLANRAYHPVSEDASAARGGGGGSALYQQYVNHPEAWKTIASRLEVEGMFNVNSTSVVAWRALLGHARNQRIPYIRPTTSSWNIGLSDEENFPFSRFVVAGDVESKSASLSGDFPGAAEFTGYRVFTGGMMDRLAEEIVRQVRARGPFLSLSEFVNRQLSSGELAMAGAMQTALNELAKPGSGNPYAELQARSNVSSAATPSAGSNGYQFAAAAEGSSAYGLPGWIRQADVLRPLAPVLSARDDTFTIRAYGDARSRGGEVLATAVCEATVRRSRDFVDPAEAAELAAAPGLFANRSFGRRYQVLSFRWLNPSEI